jgi:hypothetical protein
MQKIIKLKSEITWFSREFVRCLLFKDQAFYIASAWLIVIAIINLVFDIWNITNNN